MSFITPNISKNNCPIIPARANSLFRFDRFPKFTTIMYFLFSLGPAEYYNNF